MKIVRVVSLKLSQTVWKLWPAQGFKFRRDNYITKKMRVVSLAWDMPTGPPLYSYQILSKFVLGCQSYGAHKSASMDFRGNYITKKERVVSLARDMPAGPPVYSYQILSKYL